MLEITPENAGDYLRSKTWIGGGDVRVTALAGGVSNAVLRVEAGPERFVLKQSRAQLRTKDSWFSDLDRIWREVEVMRALATHLPDWAIPRVLFVDRENYAFAMSLAPEGAVAWKEALLTGDIDAGMGDKAGRVLSLMHEGSACGRRVFEAFADHTVYVQLRVDPFYRRVQERRSEVAPAVARIVEEMLTRKDALCHGDYTPKNMLIHSQGFMLVDYETAHFGDPTMDLGLFLAHLFLKAFRRPDWHERYFATIRSFWERYAAGTHFAPRYDLERRGTGHLGVCLLARIDGTSPVEYLPEEGKREAVRRLGRAILNDGLRSWSGILDWCGQALNSPAALGG